MKQKLATTLFGVVLLLAFQFVNATIEISIPVKATDHNATIDKTVPIKTIQEFLSLTPKKYKELTGKRMTLTQKVSLKLIQIKMKRQLRIHDAINSFDNIDFKDPVDKWMWFWIFAWGIGFVILFLPGVWILSGLFFLAGLIFLIVWLVKKFG